jgi:glycosyltransferase involved in cell wall biosynthesis
MQISVIICTYNRAGILRQTLETFCRLHVEASLPWELLVVDNNSTDDTHACCEEFARKLPLRYVFEPRQGLSAARNRGIKEAHGDLLAFTDDDVDVDPHWLAALHDAATRHPEVVFFGGRILPCWEIEPPDWLQAHSASLLKGVTTHFDLGPEERFYKGSFFGANMAFRKSIFDAGENFREDLGRKQNVLVHGEESELIGRLSEEGHKGLYVPAATVHHRIPASRMTESYVRNWFIGHGITKVRRAQVHVGLRVFSAPLSAWIKLAWYHVVYALTRWILPSNVWLRAETRLATCQGIIQESRRARSG